MAAVGTVTIIWRGGEHEFCLAKVGEVLALEEACRAGIGEILLRLETGRYYLNDIRETVRLGLIGGGMDKDRARAAVSLHVDGHPGGLAPSLILAHTILKAVILGGKDEPLGKPAAAEAVTAPPSFATMGASAAQPSTASEPLSDLHPETPTNSHSGKSPPASRDTTTSTAATAASPHH